MQRRFTGLLLRPSFFSSVVNTSATLLLLGIANWSQLLDKLQLRPYIFGPEGIVGRLREGSSSYDAIFGGNISYGVLIFATAFVVGITVYIILQLSSRLSNDASAIWESLHAQTERGTREIARRTGIRVTITIGWLVYIALFIKLVLPWCTLASESAIGAIPDMNGWLLAALAALSLWFAWHMHAIFLRLLFLRPRVFGGNDELLTDEFRGHTFTHEQQE